LVALRLKTITLTAPRHGKICLVDHLPQRRRGRDRHPVGPRSWVRCPPIAGLQAALLQGLKCERPHQHRAAPARR
jgi:hypothetical protein